ncbi:MAG TPA: VWA domain-containing protein [Vicinamibacterales bacterium]|nr:VWA domain-containing protein [Vicinamibacterales bacterium]
MKRITSVTFLVVLAGAAGLIAQQAPAFRAGVQTVPIYATVVDAAGRLVPSLEREHFEVLDNGVLQPLTFFQSDVQPIKVVVMLDTSGSMTLHLKLLMQAAEQFVLRLLPADRARIGSFSDKIILSPTFTGDRDELIRIIHNDIQYGNPTHLWDAIDHSMTALSREEGRRVVLIFTDGADMFSKKTSHDEVLARALKEEFMIYAIGLQTQILGQPPSRPDRGLRKLAEETGGGYFELKTTTDLGPTFTRVADELHRQYVLGFSPTTLDGKPHRIDVRVKVDGMTARARKSYVASKPGTGLDK